MTEMGENIAVAMTSVDQLDEEKCKYCKKTVHDFANDTGTNIGSGAKLRKSIVDGVEEHAWYTGPNSLQAHHLICSEAMDDDDWYDLALKFGYSINHENNGVMLPNQLALSCQLHVALHRGNHSKGQAAGVAYPDRIKTDLEQFVNDARSGKYCSNPKDLVEKLDSYSKRIAKKIDTFRWTITSDGADYKTGGCGCAGVSSITRKPRTPCPNDRSHRLMKYGSAKIIPRKSEPLEVGK